MLLQLSDKEWVNPDAVEAVWFDYPAGRVMELHVSTSRVDIILRPNDALAFKTLNGTVEEIKKAMTR